ncbi:hypothetical protein ACI3LX_003054 [Candidozyma auris]
MNLNRMYTHEQFEYRRGKAKLHNLSGHQIRATEGQPVATANTVSNTVSWAIADVQFGVLLTAFFDKSRSAWPELYFSTSQNQLIMQFSKIAAAAVVAVSVQAANDSSSSSGSGAAAAPLGAGAVGAGLAAVGAAALLL